MTSSEKVRGEARVAYIALADHAACCLQFLCIIPLHLDTILHLDWICICRNLKRSGAVLLVGNAVCEVFLYSIFSAEVADTVHDSVPTHVHSV